jgi:orotidine-5'-phosphate decarboxylase
MSGAASVPYDLAKAREKLIVALDFETPREAWQVVSALGDRVASTKSGWNSHIAEVCPSPEI